MKTMKYLGFLAITAGLLVNTGRNAPAQVSVNIGEPPVCPYGYDQAPPYNCAPDGYYGPEWFSGGIFFGAGPWFHGPEHFYGHVDHHLDYRKDITEVFPRGASGPRNTARNFTAKQCTTHITRPPGDAGNYWLSQTERHCECGE